MSTEAKKLQLPHDEQKAIDHAGLLKDSKDILQFEEAHGRATAERHLGPGVVAWAHAYLDLHEQTRVALKELLELKELKHKNRGWVNMTGNEVERADYVRRKPMAWEGVRRVFKLLER